MKTKVIILDSDNLSIIKSCLEEIYGEKVEIKGFFNALDFEDEKEPADLYFLQAALVNDKVISLEKIIDMNPNAKIIVVSDLSSFREKARENPMVHYVFSKDYIIMRGNNKKEQLIDLLN